MSWVKRKLDKLDSIDRSYYLMKLIILSIPFPLFLMKQVTPWLGLLFFLTPLVIMHKDIWIYLSHIKATILTICGITISMAITTFFSDSEGFKAFMAAVYIIGGVTLALLAYNKLVKHMESIGIE